MSKYRGFEAAQLTRLSEDWSRTPTAPNQDVRDAYAALLARARDLYENNSHVKGFIHFRLPSQILGSQGIQILPQVEKTRGGALNKTTNDRLRIAWRDWCKVGSCTMDGASSFVDVQQQILEAIVRDGECLVHMVRGRAARNRYHFALHILEGEHLDATYDARMGSGNRVIMGKEIDRWRRPIAYHVQVENPADLSFTFRSFTRERVEAKSMLHPYIPLFPSQIRGVSWLHAGAGEGRMLEKYREAELVAARIAASKAVMLEAEDPGLAAKISGHSETTHDDGTKTWAIEDQVEPGQTSAIPPGWKASMLDPTHPNGNFADFETAILRGMAAGLGASYHGFSNDLSNVNYSSARMGAIDEREVWRRLQRWFIEHVLEPIFAAWLEMALLGDHLKIPAQTMPAVLDGVRWQARGYTWVDPAKESKAAGEELDRNLTSRTRILASRGEDFAEVAAQIAEENDLLDSLGIRQTSPEDADPPDPAAADDEDGDRDDVKDDDDDDQDD